MRKPVTSRVILSMAQNNQEVNQTVIKKEPAIKLAQIPITSSNLDFEIPYFERIEESSAIESVDLINVRLRPLSFNTLRLETVSSLCALFCFPLFELFGELAHLSTSQEKSAGSGDSTRGRRGFVFSALPASSEAAHERAA